MKKLLVLTLAAVLALAACQAPIPSKGSGSHVQTNTSSDALPGEHCADLLATALSSPDAPVPGTFACQAPELVQIAQDAGVTNDADIQAFAKALGYTSAIDLGASGNAFTFLLVGPTSAEVLVVWTDSNGKVVEFRHSRRQ